MKVRDELLIHLFLFSLMLLVVLSFLSLACRALVREALSLNGDWKARARFGGSVS
jgi:hypothetical protein